MAAATPAPRMPRAPAPAGPASATTASATLDFDLVPKMARYLDPHLMFPLLNFLQGTKIYAEADIKKAMAALASEKTKMVDYAATAHREAFGTEMADVAAKKEAESAQWQALQATCSSLLALVDDGEGHVTQEARALQEASNWTAEYLAQNLNINQDAIEGLYLCARHRFETGHYDIAGSYLYWYRMLVPATHPRSLQALWGKLAAEILSLHYDEALLDLKTLKAAIDTAPISKLMQLQQRSWMLHWSLFVLFFHPKGREELLDLFMSNLQTIQTNCPWLLRYLAAVAIVQERRRGMLKDVVRAIQQEEHVYTDPITEFVQCLMVKFDFEAAQAKLVQCQSVLLSDMFLSATGSGETDFATDFMESARMFIFETYCRLHKKVDIAMLATKLNMPPTDAERWIVELIRRTAVDAKIDCQENQVIMAVRNRSVYQQVIEKTKDLFFRSNLLATELERLSYHGGEQKRDDRHERRGRKNQNQNQNQNQRTAQ